MTDTQLPLQGLRVLDLSKVLAGPLWDEEGILTAEIDRRQIARGKFDLDVVGHYARSDVFRLVVDDEAKPAVKAKSPSKAKSK